MPTYEPWSVVVVPFPFTERLRSKRRPAVVLSPAAFQNTHGCGVLAMVTDARNPRWASDVVLGDLDAAGSPSRPCSGASCSRSITGSRESHRPAVGFGSDGRVPRVAGCDLLSV